MTTPVAPGSPAAPAPKPNGTTATPPASQPNAEVETLRKQLSEAQERASRLEKKTRVDNVEMMKFRDEKKGLGGKLTEHATFDRAFKKAGLTPTDLESFKINPEPVFKKVFGDGWYDKVVEMKLNGGAVSADVVAAGFAQTKEELRAELKAEAEAERAAQTKNQQEREQQAREQLVTEADGFLAKSGGEYPIFEGLPRAQVARAVAQFVENEYHRTGKVLTSKEACEGLEAAEIARAERLAAHDKYRGKLTEKLKPATVVPVVGARSAGSTQFEQRRTQPNDPQQKRTFRTDEERRAAAMALKLPGE